MRRVYFILAVFVLLLLAGCSNAPQKKEEPLPAIPAPKIEVENETNLSAVEKTVPDLKPASIIAPEVKVLFSRNAKLSSYHYEYYIPPNDALGVGFSVLLNKKAKLVYPKSIKLYDKDFYDTIYFEFSNSSAVAYCEGQFCKNRGSLIVNSSDYYPAITPFDFVASVESAYVKGSETIEGRKVSVISFSDKNGKNGTMWVETTYGVPLKVVVDNSKYEFRSATFNSVTEADVSHNI